MANTNVFETKLSNRMQITRYSTPVYLMQASFEEHAMLFNGDTVDRPTFGRLYSEDYVRGVDMTEQGYVENSEQININTTPAILLRTDKFDKIQHKTNIMDRLAKDGARAVGKTIDADYLGEVLNATSTVDAGDVGGTAGNPIALDANNVIRIFAASQRKLQNLDVDIVGMKDPRPDHGNMKPMGAGGFANLAPYFNEQLVVALANKESQEGEMVGRNGYKRTYFDFDNFVTTNGLAQLVLSLATNPTDGDTITINSVVVTFVATLSGGDAEIHIASTVDITRANFVEWLNAGGKVAEVEATDTGYSVASATKNSLGTSDQDRLRRMTATNDNTANTATISAQGYGHVVVSDVLTDATDTWTSEISKQMLGQKGAVDMVLQAKINVEVDPIPKQFGKYIKPNALYGKKTFTEGQAALVCVDIDSSDWS